MSKTCHVAHVTSVTERHKRMTGQTVTQVVNKTRLYPPVQNKTASSTLDQVRLHDNLDEVRNHGNQDQISAEDKVTLCDALKLDGRETLPPICWDDTYWRESTIMFVFT